MAPFVFCVCLSLFTFSFFADFCKKILRPEALGATIRVGLDLEHPDFFRPLAWTGV
jgi:hypothetical protein